MSIKKLSIKIVSPIILLYSHFTAYFINDVIPHVPCWQFRKLCYILKGMKIGKHTTINLRTRVKKPDKIYIGNGTHINSGVLLDGRGGLKIGNNVSISFNVAIVTGSHDIQTKRFDGRFLPIEVEDNVWIGVNATILQNVKIGKGAVVAAGAVVVKDVEQYTIVGGVPAKVIGKRREDLDYTCDNTFANFI